MRSPEHRPEPAEATPATSGPTPSAEDDELLARLVQRARDGDMQAWSRLYQRNFDPIFRHLRVLTGDSNVAEELTQETFAQALVSLPRFRGDAKFSTWLHRVAINIVRKHWRWQRNTDTAHERLATMDRLRDRGGADPDRETIQRARAKVLYAILDAMPDTLREVFVLRDLEVLPQREIAARLDISEGNVAVRATRARAHVRAELERLGWLAPTEGK
jgi:RNA polymerase sigma-70 factor (ECF subfamily)